MLLHPRLVLLVLKRIEQCFSFLGAILFGAFRYHLCVLFVLLALELRLLIEEVLEFDVEDGCFHPLVDVVFDVVVGEGD